MLWSRLHHVFDGFKGNAEKFYSSFYALMQPKCVKLFSSLSTFSSNLLSTEVANLCLKTLSTSIVESSVSKKRSDIVFTEKDTASLQYLSGFCFRTIYSRLRNSPKHRTTRFDYHQNEAGIF